MIPIEETAYPQLPTDATQREFEQLFRFSAAEVRFVHDAVQPRMQRACLGMHFKLLQRLGYSVPLSTVPLAAFGVVCAQLGVPRPSKAAIEKYDATGRVTTHQRVAMKELRLKLCSRTDMAWINERARFAAATKQELADIINVLIEELSRKRLVLPGFTLLFRAARSARDSVNGAIYKKTLKSLDKRTKDRLEGLWESKGGRTDWDMLKREPKRPTTREVISFLQHIKWLTTFTSVLPDMSDIAPAKRAQLTLEARAQDAARIRSLPIGKRLTLAVLLIQAQHRKANDDIADIFVKTVRKLDGDASRALQAYQLAHTEQVERLISQLKDVLEAYTIAKPPKAKVAAIGESLVAAPDVLIAECEEHMAFADMNYYPFMLRPYSIKRSLLFECLAVLAPKLTYTDPDFEDALGWVTDHRDSRKEYLSPVRKAGGPLLDLKWLAKKWKNLIVVDDPDGEILVDRKYLEIAVFMRVQDELQSGDLFIPNSEQFDDYRENLADEETYRRELADYAELVGIPSTSAAFCKELRKQLEETARDSDAKIGENDSIAWGPSGLIIRKPPTSEPPVGFDAIDQAINDLLGEVSIIDVLTETEKWLSLHSAFGPTLPDT